MFDKYIGKAQSFYVLNSCKTISPIFPLCFTSDPHIGSAPFWAASKVNSRSTQSQYIYLTSPLCQCFPGPHYHGIQTNHCLFHNSFAKENSCFEKRLEVLGKMGTVLPFGGKFSTSFLLFTPLDDQAAPQLHMCRQSSPRCRVTPSPPPPPLREIVEPFLKPILSLFSHFSKPLLCAGKAVCGVV